MKSSMFRFVLTTVLLWSNPGSGRGADFVKVLTDLHGDVSVKNWRLTSKDVDSAEAGAQWSVTKRMLAGGRQDGVEVIDVDNGAMQFTVVPTRGFSVWSLRSGDLRFGWDSPVREIVHPQFVDLGARGPRANERAAGRLPKLQGGQSYRAQIIVDALTSVTDVRNTENRIKNLQATEPIVSATPRPAGS